MRSLKLVFMLLGLALFGLLLYQIPLDEVWYHLRSVGTWGLVVVLAVYFLAFSADTLAWALAFPSRALDRRWLGELWNVNLIGEAFNRVTPLASFGGEPIKVALLNRRSGVGYREATVSLIVAQTIGAVAMVLFLACGFALMFGIDEVPTAYRQAAAAGFVGFALSIAAFFLVQRYKVLTRAGSRLGRGRLGARVQSALALVHDIEDRLIHFYVRHRARFLLATSLSFLNWLFGAVEAYLVLAFLGHPVAFSDAVVIESTVLLVRSVLFFVPANIGTQDGAMVFMCGAITGSPTVALALALVVRFRELVWAAAGLLAGGLLPSGRHAMRAGGEPHE